MTQVDTIESSVLSSAMRKTRTNEQHEGQETNRPSGAWSLKVFRGLRRLRARIQIAEGRRGVKKATEGPDPTLGGAAFGCERTC